MKGITALVSRWSQHVNKCTMRFQGIFTTVVGVNASGATHTDHVSTALTLYEKATWNTSRTPFPFMACWERLRVHPKWGGLMSTEDRKRKRSTSDIHIDGEDIDIDDTMYDGAALTNGGRPEGCKKSKQNVKEEKIASLKREDEQSQRIAFERMAKASEEKVSALQHLNQLNSAKLFTVEHGATPEEVKEYNDLLRRRAFLSLRAGTTLTIFKTVFYLALLKLFTES